MSGSGEAGRPGPARGPGPARRPDPASRPGGANRPEPASRPDGASRPDAASRPDGASRPDAGHRGGAHRRVTELLTRPLAHGLDYAWVAATAARSTRGMLRRDGWRPGTPEGGGATPVVLLPGVYESWHMLARVGRAVADAGHPVAVIPDLGLNDRPVLDGARRTAAHLAALDLDRVVLVAHSKGGLVGKAVMLGPEGRRVAGLVSVATPWRGSLWARAFPPWSVVGALRPAHPDLARLAARTEVDARIVSLNPAWDPHIPGGSFLPGARNVPLRERGHFRPLGSRAVHDLVVEHVRRLAGAD